MAGVDEKVGDATALLGAEASDALLEEEEVELTEPPVPRRTRCLSPAAPCDARRVGDNGPDDQENSGEAGEEVVDDVVVVREMPEDGSWCSLRTTMRVMCMALRANLLEAYSRASVR